VVVVALSEFASLGNSCFMNFANRLIPTFRPYKSGIDGVVSTQLYLQQNVGGS
jgi:hypothetical protein